jgi:hypothetical protein
MVKILQTLNVLRAGRVVRDLEVRARDEGLYIDRRPFEQVALPTPAR